MALEFFMSQTFPQGVCITMVGVSAATGGASARSAIPVTSSGNLPMYVRIAARNECYVKIGDSAVAATANDILIQPADSVFLQVPKGLTHIAYIQGTGAGMVNITAVENS